MNEDNKEDVKNEDNTSSDSSAGKKDSSASEGVKNTEKKPEETPEEKAKRLADGTYNNKVIPIEKDRWDRISDRAKILDSIPPAVIDRILQDPEFAKKALEKSGGLEERVAKIEAENDAKVRAEISSTLTEAVQKWPDFEKTWPEIQEDVKSTVKRGIPYKEAVRRHYLAVHPEALQAEAERIAKENLNRTDISFSSGSAFKIKSDGGEEVKLTPGQAEVATMYGIKAEDYGRLLKKWEPYLRAKGFYKPELEVPYSQKL